MSKTIVTLLASVLALVTLSTWSLYSALMLYQEGDAMLLNQLGAVGIGFLGFAMMAWVDYRKWNHPAWAAVIYVMMLGLLVAVLVPGIGKYKNGAQRWLLFFQPSELAKAAVVFCLAWFGARYQHRITSWKWGLVAAWSGLIPVLALIFMEPDRGTTLFLLGLSGLVLLVAGARWYHMGMAGLFAALLLIPALMRDDVVKNRLAAFKNPDAHKSTSAFQNRQALYAFGEGGLTGTGPGAGVMMRTIPEQHTDFILPVIGEELGFIGASLVLAAFVSILFCGATIARRAGDAGDTFGLLLAAGITFLIVAQAFFNIGIVTNLFPNKGLALPFVSRGGTNIVVMLTLVGTLISIGRHVPLEKLPVKATLRARDPNPFAEFPS